MKSLFSFLLIFALLLGGMPRGAAARDTTLGDVDGNGTVTATDALQVLRNVVGKSTLTPYQISACDVDYSDSVNATDALHILKYTVKRITEFSPNLTGRVLTLATVYPIHFDASTNYGAAMRMGITNAVAQYGVEEVLVNTISLKELEECLFYYDVVEMPSENARSLAKKGLLKNLRENAGVNWQLANSGSTLSCTMGNMICGVASPAMSTVPLGIAMNKTLLQQYAPVGFAKLQEQFTKGTWDFDALTALCDEYRSNQKSGGILISNTNIIGQAIVANCGYEVKFLEDGSGAVSSIATDEGIAALQYVRELKTKGYFTYEANIGTMLDTFALGKVPMVVYHLSEVGRWSDGSVSLTAMPFPKGPAMTTYTMGAFGCPTFVMPASSPDYGNSSAALLNSFMLYNNDIENAVVRDSKAMGFDALGQETFRFAAKHTSPDLSTGAFTGAVGQVVDGSVLNPQGNPQKDIPAIKGLIQREVDACYRQFYQ